MVPLIIIIVVAIFVIVVLFRSIRIIPQAYAGVVERLGRYQRTLSPGLTILVPFVDRLRPLVDLREQVVSFPPQPVITEDNLVVSIDTVVYFQVTDARAATYEIANYLGAVEQLTTTTLRNVVGGLNLEEALTRRDEINGQLRIVLDEATGKWGIRVNRVELKAIDPPHSIQDSMEKQMRADARPRAVDPHRRGRQAVADPDRRGRAAGGDPQGRGRREGDDARGRGRGEGHPDGLRGDPRRATPTRSCSPTSTCRRCRRSRRAQANKLWIIPSELTEALKGKMGSLVKGDGKAGA